jgi:hypothetical protein
MKNLCLVLAMLLAVPNALAGGNNQTGAQGVLQPEYIPAGSHDTENTPLPALPAPRVHGSSSDLVPIPPGTYTIGPGGTYPTLADAVADLQTSGVAGGGTVFFHFNTSMTYSGAGQTIGGYPGQSAANPVVFRPAPGITATVNFVGGTGVDSTFGLRFLTAAGVTWDGSNSGGTDRSLTLNCDTTAATGRTGVLIQAGSSFLTFKNLNIAGYRKSTNAANTVIVIDSTGNSANGANHDLLITNCHLRRGFNGIFQFGRSGALLDFNIMISNNLIGGGSSPNLLDHLFRSGINLVQAATNVVIDQNDVSGVKPTNATTPFGIEVRGAHSNITVTRNKIHDIAVLTGAVRPIAILVGNIVTAGPPVKTTALFANNMVYDIHNLGAGTGGRAVEGVVYNPTGPFTGGSPNGNGTTIEWINNSFNLDLAAGEAGGLLTSFVFDANSSGQQTSGIDTIRFYNNVASSRRADGAGSRMWLVINPAAGMTPGVRVIESDYNLYYQNAGPFGQYPAPYPNGTTATFATTLADWQSATGHDPNSRFGDPLFVSSTDAHIDSTFGHLSPADSMAIPWPGITMDIDGQPRDTSFPDAGADEFSIALADVDYAMLSLSQQARIPTPFGPYGDLPTTLIALNMGSKAAPASPSANRSRLLPNSDVVTTNLPVTLKAAVKNQGMTSPSYQVTWTFDGVAQTPVSRGGIPSLEVDSVTLSLTPPERGTFTATATAVVSGDQVLGNNSQTYNKVLSYPDPNIRLRYDNGSHTPQTTIGFGVTLGDIECGVRFTATEGIKLANIDAYYRNETSTDSITVKVYAAGIADTVPGSLLYSKKFAGVNYISASGEYVTLPLGNDAPTFALGSDFWVSILIPPGTQFPMGAQSTGITTGRSFGSADSGATWFPLVLAGPPVTEYAWLLRVVGVSPGVSTVTLNVPIGTNWNIVSLPVGDPTPNDSVLRVFENSANAYAYAFVNNQYVQRFTLSKGPGYWIKSNQAYTQDITGTPVDSLTIPVVNNWNMIGSISSSIDTSSARVTPNPANLRASVFYQFNTSPPLGYQAATTIVPGRGYWVKANGAGTFHMHIVGVPRAGKTEEPPVTQGKTLDDLHTLTIEDATGGSQTLYFGADGAGEIPVMMYEMPPLPPAGMFDARFSTATGGYLVQTHGEEVQSAIEMPIAVQTESYPLTVRWKTNGTAATYELSDGAGGVQTLRGEGTLRISGSNSHLTLRVTGSGTLLPKEYALYQNYPNPFNPTTTVKYALPVDSKVTVEMYNIIGQRVRTLVSTEQAAGYYLTEWNGQNDGGAQLASGMYFMRMSAGGKDGRTFSDVRKVMLLK